MKTNLWSLCFVMTVALALASPLYADDTPPVIKPEDAAKMVDKLVTVEMEVKSASLRDTVCFLNSHEDHRNKANFTVFIGRDGLPRFKESMIDDPADHFKGKRIRVTGKVTLFRDKPQITVTKADEIKIVEKQQPAEKQQPGEKQTEDLNQKE